MIEHFLFTSEYACNRANFEINISGSSRLTLGEDQIVYKGLNETEDGLELNYEYNKEHLRITTELKLIGGTNVIVQKNKIKNIGDGTIKLTRFSSAFIVDIAYGENTPYYRNDDITVNICHSKWQGEGQWKKYTLPELGIYPTTIHDSERESFKINSVGSWSTANFYPLAIIEDNKKKNTWFMETEGSHSWYIKLASYGGYTAPSLSLEACNETAFGYNMDEDSILKRYDVKINGWRSFYNFSNPKVREYLTGKVEALYNIGFRFIKNDYNASIGIGATNNYDGDSPAEGAIVNANTFYSFVESLYEKFPDLVIENCGSGALRCDNKMLRRCYLQSTSDQEFYYNNPSIVMGSMAVMPPEKAGIWSYPYPAMYPYKDGKYVPFAPDEEYIDRMKDGKETAFNMVTAMTGYLYLSGRIEFCDEKNFALVKEAVDFYKNIRKYISVSRPIYPLGMVGINEKKTAALGLLSENKLLLAVWNITDEEKTVELPLEEYLNSEIVVDSVYPAKAKYSVSDRTVSLKLSSLEAVYIEITI